MDDRVPEMFLPAELSAPAAEPVDLAEPAAGQGRPLLRSAAIVVAGLAAGAVAVAVLQSPSPSTPALAGTSQVAQQAVPQDGDQGPVGGVEGETRLVGTLSAVGASSITVRGADGTTTVVPVDASTEIVRDGTTAALADLRSGEQVLVHVVPAGSGTVAERVYAGELPRRGRHGGFGPPPGDQDGGAPASTATTTSQT